MSNTVDIIVIGTDHHNTLSMVRSFGESGYKVILIVYGKARSYVASSIYVKESHIVSDSKATIECLKDLCKSACEKPVVITCPDEISSMMDLQYEEFKDVCYFFNAGVAGRITDYMDKQKQLLLAKECGFSVPKSQESKPDKVDTSIIDYPCFVKPKESIHGGKHIASCNNELELVQALSTYDNHYEVLVQDFIKKDYEIVILGLSNKGHHYIPGYIEKHREFRGGTTYSTTHSIISLSESIVGACKKMIEQIGYQGLWGIECIKQGSDFFFLELNMRNDATSYAMAVAGINLPLIYYKLSIGELVDRNTIQEPEQLDSMVEFEDFNFVLKREIGLFKWLSQRHNCKCKYFESKADKRPSSLRRKEYIHFLFNRVLHL